MTDQKRYVCDTCSLISYFDTIFEPLGAGISLSNSARAIIDEAISPTFDNIKLSIPSVVFFEIFDKWLLTEENTRKFFYDAFSKLRNSPNVEIKPIERGVMEKLVTIEDELFRHEIYDKIVVASAIELECPLLTTDTIIIEYNKKRGRIPKILS